MLSLSFVLTAVTGLLSLPNANGLFTEFGVARLPVMGYNTWNAYHCNITQDLVLKTADQMEALGLKEAGYNYVNIDDCYSLKDRNSSGYIVADPDKFKNMRQLTDELHSRDFQSGIYSDSGTHTCAYYPGSWGNEDKDVDTFFGEWGFDYLKYDNCYLADGNPGNLERFTRMHNSIIRATDQFNKPIVYSLCEWGEKLVWLWGADIAHSWRTTGDIEANWASIASILNANSFITQATNFYGHNDLDMLEVGNGDLTYEESKSHFTFWALLKSPLFIGTDLTKLNADSDTIKILTNKEIIAINQDNKVGTSIAPFRWGVNEFWTNDSKRPAQYWSGPTKDGVVIALLNVLDEPAKMSLDLSESPWVKSGCKYSVRDLWTHTDNGTASGTYTVDNVPAHGTIALLLREVGA